MAEWVKVCRYCDHVKSCPFLVVWWSREYYLCEDCVDEAGLDGFSIWFKPE